MSGNFESKFSGAFNFIGIVALKLCTNSHNLFMKMTHHVMSKSQKKKKNVKDIEKQKYKVKAI